MKHFRSELAFQKHKPIVSSRQKFLNLFKQKNRKSNVIKALPAYKGNPFKIIKHKTLIVLKMTAWLVPFILWVVLLAYLPYFRITHLTISGLNSITEQEIKDFLIFEHLTQKNLIPRSNYFLVNPDKISSDLLKKFALENATVTKNFPNQIQIGLTEKISSLIYDDGSAYYLLDASGSKIKFLASVEPYEIVSSTHITDDASATSGLSSTSTTTTGAIHMPDYKKINKLFGTYPIVYATDAAKILNKNDGILPAKIINEIILWQMELIKQGIAEAKYFIIDNPNAGVLIETNKAWRVYFMPGIDYLYQINNLNMDEILLKTFPVQSKSYSGFFRISNVTTPYTLILTKSILILKFIGIPFIKINLSNILSFKYIGDEWIAMQKVFNGVVIKYKKGDKIKERVITFFNKKKSLEFIKILRNYIGNKEE